MQFSILSRTLRLRASLAPVLIGLPLILILSACKDETPELPAQVDPETRRVLSAGALLGRKELYNSHAWLGIPYAAAPIGPLRWKAPRSVPSWAGERKALQHGALCPQLAGVLGGTKHKPGTVIGNEDCLFLNVYAPRYSPKKIPAGAKALPVIVWIHGGANRAGGTFLYNGGRLAVKENVIVVAVQYRLGALGWFRHGTPVPGDTREERSGNFALLDLMAALRWVRGNIAAFGGNPTKITIMGQSAGAGNVLSLVFSPRGKGLFQRAIVQSAFPRLRSPTAASHLKRDGGHENSSAEVAARLLLAAGRARDLPAARVLATTMPSKRLVEFLRKQSAARILDAFRHNLNGESPARTWYPFVSTIQDGHVLPTGDWRAMARGGGSASTVPIIIGANLDEDNLYLAIDDAYMYRIFGLIPRIREPDFYDAVGDHLSASWRLNGVHRPARILREINPAIFAYRFDWDEEPTLFGTDLGVALGAAHAFEIPFVFGHYRLGSADKYMFTAGNLTGREDVSQAMMAYWAGFARTGRPGRGRGREPLWEPYGSDERVMIFDTKSGGGRRMVRSSLTRESLLEAIAADKRLEQGKHRCKLYKRLAKDRLTITKEQMARWQC